METEDIKKAINGYGEITKDQADVFAKAGIVMLTILLEKYDHMVTSEKEPLEKAIEVLSTFVELPL